MLIDAAWVATHLTDPDVRLIELDVSRAAYDAGHIPGAIWIDPKSVEARAAKPGAPAVSGAGR